MGSDGTYEQKTKIPTFQLKVITCDINQKNYTKRRKIVISKLISQHSYKIEKDIKTCPTRHYRQAYQICAKIFTGKEVLESTSRASTPA